jgi:2-phospho-L-lactate guanylyltransferase
MTLLWVAVVPVKRFAVAKSRLDPGVDGRRQALARAFAADTVTALRAVAEIHVVVVVTGDQQAGRSAQGPGVVVLDEPEPGGLNQAAAAGIRWSRQHHRSAAVAVISADLPALRPQDVSAVLGLAAAHPSAVVADREGTGTTMLTALPDVAVEPRFGPGSLARHRAGGAVVVSAPDLVRAARDVDTASHLAEAVALGVGSETARVLDS